MAVDHQPLLLAARRGRVLLLVLALLCCLPSHALTSPSKTRVGGCDRLTPGRFSLAEAQAFENAMGLERYGYESASGRPQWLNHDPIQERGGYNLYAFVGNTPVNVYDAFGLEGGVLVEPTPTVPRPGPGAPTPTGPKLPPGAGPAAGAAVLICIFDRCVDAWPMPKPDALPLPSKLPRPRPGAPGISCNSPQLPPIYNNAYYNAKMRKAEDDCLKQLEKRLETNPAMTIAERDKFMEECMRGKNFSYPPYPSK